MDAQRGVASRLYLTFLQGTLERKCGLDPVDLASLEVTAVAKIDGFLARVLPHFQRLKILKGLYNRSQQHYFSTFHRHTHLCPDFCSDN